MKASELAGLLSRTIPEGLSVLVTSAPGVGKTDIVRQAAKAAGRDIIVSHPAVADPTDAKGLPWAVPDADGRTTAATFLPFGDLARALAATPSAPVVWFLDDLGQASQATQSSYMQLLLTPPANVTFVAATNRRTDRAGVTGILEPVKSRFHSIVSLDADVDEWSNWAFGHDIPPELIAFLRFRPELLSAFVPTADLTNSPSPRTWAHAARLAALGLPRSVEAAAMAGAVGEGPAMEFLAFRADYAAAVSVDSILLDPDAAALPPKPSTRYAVCTALAMRATAGNFGRIVRYCGRLMEASAGEFAALTLRDIIRRDELLPAGEKKIQKTPDFVRVACGPLGKLIAGGAE